MFATASSISFMYIALLMTMFGITPTLLRNLPAFRSCHHSYPSRVQKNPFTRALKSRISKMIPCADDIFQAQRMMPMAHIITEETALSMKEPTVSYKRLENVRRLRRR
jgi:hypothetical protein